MTAHMPTSSLVSILIRSTARPELAVALASVAAQTYPAIEVLVVDASGEGAVLAPTAYALPLRVLSQGRRLQRSVAANVLLEAAQGRWGLFLDDDDWLAADHVERLVAALEAEPQLVVAYAGVRCVEADPQAVDGFTEVRRFDEVHEPARLMVENYIPINAAVFDLQLIRAPDGPRFDAALDMFEDWDFWLQLLACGPFEHVPGISAFYRIHGDSGVGVRTREAAQAEAALAHVLAKWRTRWTAAQMQQLVGLARHVFRLRTQVGQLETELAKVRSDMGYALEDARVALEQAGILHERALASVREDARAAQEQARHELSRTREAARQAAEAAALAFAKQQSHYENSRSWRLTRPLRAALDALRLVRAGQWRAAVRAILGGQG